MKTTRSVNINPKIHKRLKIEAARQEMKMGELAERILSKELKKRESEIKNEDSEA